MIFRTIRFGLQFRPSPPQMSRIPPRQLYHWANRCKRSTREPSSGPVADDVVKYSFGNGELFDELQEFVSKFNDHQRALAMSTGFGAFVEVRVSIRFDQHFCCWLMSRFDHRSRSITRKRTCCKTRNLLPENRTPFQPGARKCSYHHGCRLHEVLSRPLHSSKRQARVHH